MSKSVVSVYGLGGFDEIGKNMYAVEYEDEIVVIDCGLKFPDEDMYGVDMLFPDITYLLENKAKVKGIFLTHGHEDHIGALPYVLKDLLVPVYGTPLTIELVKAKLQEHHLLHTVQLHVIGEEDIIRYHHLSVSFFSSTHSIPDSVGVVVDTPEGPVVHTGDFKFDLTPIRQKFNIAKVAEVGQRGVLALLSDSTNSERPGFTPSEKSVGETVDRLVAQTDGRILFATFASNVYRVQQVVEASIKHGRKIAIVGRSMEKVFRISQELGYIHVPEGVLIESHKADAYPANQVTIICTGSQGEKNAALSKIAHGQHKTVQIYPGDTVVFSASPIPGNTTQVYRTIDRLERAGANVIHGSLLDIHASGHGSQEDLKLMLSLVQPKYFIPIHGEYRMMRQHGRLAEDVGVPEENIFIMENGYRLLLSQERAALGSPIPAGTVMVDGKGVGDVGRIVLRDRNLLGAGGVIVVTLTVDMKQFKVLSGPHFVSRGFVYVRESDNLMARAEHVVNKTVQKLLASQTKSWSLWKSRIQQELSRFIVKETGRDPMILPIMMEAKRSQPEGKK